MNFRSDRLEAFASTAAAHCTAAHCAGAGRTLEVEYRIPCSARTFSCMLARLRGELGKASVRVDTVLYFQLAAKPPWHPLGTVWSPNANSPVRAIVDAEGRILHMDVKRELETVTLQPVDVEGRRTAATGKCCEERPLPPRTAAAVADAVAKWTARERHAKAAAMGGSTIAAHAPARRPHEVSGPSGLLLQHWDQLKFVSASRKDTRGGPGEERYYVLLPGAVAGTHLWFGAMVVLSEASTGCSDEGAQISAASAPPQSSPITGFTAPAKRARRVGGNTEAATVEAHIPVLQLVLVKRRRRHTFAAPGYNVDCTEFYTDSADPGKGEGIGEDIGEGKGEDAREGGGQGRGQSMFNIEVEINTTGTGIVVDDQGGNCSGEGACLTAAHYLFPERLRFLISGERNQCVGDVGALAALAPH